MERDTNAVADWCALEFANIKIGDQRIKQRFINTACLLAKHPASHIPEACGSRAATKGAYRLFANSKVEPKEIVAAHAIQTVNRIRQDKFIFAIQDSSTASYESHRKTEGLGPIAGSDRSYLKGLIFHSTLAVNSKGVPQGLLHQMIWARDTEDVEEFFHESSESQKWFEASRAVLALVPPTTEVITIADREGDITSWMEEMVAEGMHFLIRAKSSHVVVGGKKQKIRDYLRAQTRGFNYEVEVTIKKGRNSKPDKRVAQVVGSFAPVVLRGKKKKPSLKLYAVHIYEPNPPEGQDGVEWILLTNKEVTSSEQALEKIQWYKLRWHIETFHKVLKSGCTIEECRLMEAKKLMRYMSLMSAIACRLYWANHLSRQEPESSCEKVLLPHEWQALYCRMNKTPRLPEQPPTIRQAIHWIAQLGGFLGRKSDGEPGVTTIWRGWRRLEDIAEAWLIFNNGAATSGYL